MKLRYLLLLSLFFFSSGPVAESRAMTPSSVTKTGMSQAQKKKKKGYKKPRKKKFLGIFKRKSACDCPKH